MKPVLVDLFCKAGGASRGYAEAGFEVIGVDIEPQPNYPYEFHQLDAIALLERVANGEWSGVFAGAKAVHASPPCQAYAEVANTRKRQDHPDLIGPVRDLLQRIGLPYVIENVPPAPMPNAFVLCGSTFGLPIIRHRKFEVSPDIGLVPSSCPQSSWLRGTGHPGAYPYGRKNWGPAWRQHVLPAVWPWMTLEEAGEAIPPAYTQFIGTALLEAMEVAA